VALHRRVSSRRASAPTPLARHRIRRATPGDHVRDLVHQPVEVLREAGDVRTRLLQLTLEVNNLRLEEGKGLWSFVEVDELPHLLNGATKELRDGRELVIGWRVLAGLPPVIAELSDPKAISDLLLSLVSIGPLASQALTKDVSHVVSGSVVDRQ
jgi:hypothetical protein